MFPREYTEALSGLTDYLDPMDYALVKRVVSSELCAQGDSFSEIFEEFDELPLGAASVAQVHRATLTAKYGSREVAVKVQRPGIEQKLLGDIKNLIGESRRARLGKHTHTHTHLHTYKLTILFLAAALAKPLRGLKEMPVDYYVVFKEVSKRRR